MKKYVGHCLVLYLTLRLSLIAIYESADRVCSKDESPIPLDFALHNSRAVVEKGYG